MRLLCGMTTDYSMQCSLEVPMRKTGEWQALKPWEPFFWDDQFATGICLGCGGRPVALPPTWKERGEAFFAIRIRATPEDSFLDLGTYVFMIDPSRHTRRAVRREGYWFFEVRTACSLSESVALLRETMNSLEHLALVEDRDCDLSDAVLEKLISWPERMVLPLYRQWAS